MLYLLTDCLLNLLNLVFKETTSPSLSFILGYNTTQIYGMQLKSEM